MYLASLFAFVVAAVFGLTMAVRHFMGKDSGKAMGIVHGLWAVSGIVLLSVGLWQVRAGVWWWLLVSFLVVAAGGVYLFSRQVRGEAWPSPVIVAHGGLAIVSIVLLGVFLAVRDEPAAEDGDVPAQTTDNDPVEIVYPEGAPGAEPADDATPE